MGEPGDEGFDRGELGAGLAEKFDAFERARLLIAEREPAQAAAIAAYNRGINEVVSALNEASAPFNAAIDRADDILRSITWDIAVAAQAARDRGDDEAGFRLDDWMSALESIGGCMFEPEESMPQVLRIPRPPISKVLAGLPRRPEDVVERPAGDRDIDPGVRESVESSWRRIDAWLARSAPHLAMEINPPASPGEIAAAEEAMRAELPAAVRASYLVHDGCRVTRIFPSGDYLSLEQMQQRHALWWKPGDEYQDWQGQDPLPRGVRRVHQHPAWIPLTHNGGGDGTWIDTVPAEGGTVGQLVDFGHDAGPECVAAPGLAEYLAYLADGLEAGAVKVRERYLEWHQERGTPRSAYDLPPSAPAAKAGPRPPTSLDMSTDRYYFELREGASGKFWEVAQVGTRITTRSGKIGNKGRTTTKAFKFARSAAWQLCRLIAEKVGEGYVEDPPPG